MKYVYFKDFCDMSWDRIGCNKSFQYSNQKKEDEKEKVIKNNLKVPECGMSEEKKNLFRIHITQKYEYSCYEIY